MSENQENESKGTRIEAITEILAGIRELEFQLATAVDKMGELGADELPVRNETSARQGMKLLTRYVRAVHDHAVTPITSQIKASENKKDSTQKYVESATLQIAESQGKFAAKPKKAKKSAPPTRDDIPPQR